MVYKLLNDLMSAFFLTLIFTTIHLTHYTLATLFLMVAKFVTALEYFHFLFSLWRIFAKYL